MNLRRSASATFLLLALTGCATVQYGSKDTEAQLRELRPVAGQTSLYVCRENAAFMGAANRTTVMVDQKAIGTLKPNNFAHAVIAPGSHDIYIKRNPGGDSGVLNIRSLADEVAIIWVGMTGAGFGVLTVDFFSTRDEAEQCVKQAEYAVPALP